MPGVDLQSLLAAFPDAVLSIDRHSVIIFANEGAIRLFGFPRESFLGRTLADTIIPQELRSQHARGMERFAATGAGPVIGRRIDITACDASGRRFPIELCVFLDAGRPGEIFHASIRETSDRMAREAVISAERERLRQILDATADVWWDCTVRGSTRFSESAQQLLGVGSSQMLQAEPSALPGIHAEDRARVADAWRAHLEGEVGRFECTHRLLAPSGETRWVRQRGRAVEFDAGRPTRVVGTIADVTEQQGAEERLRNAQRLEMLGLLASGFAHDLNNYLTAIRGHAALAATEPGVSAAGHESFAAIQLATTKARMLATNMLSLGKPSAGSIARFSVRGAIEEAVDLIRPGLPRTIAIFVDARGVDGFEVELDPTSFQQALLNLVINARDAMAAGGRLRIEASPANEPSLGPMVRIVVEDTGVGIAPEVVSRVFEPFFTTKPQGIGTGLGLAVVHQVVTGAGGSVSVDSDLGRGTRFTLVLPAHRATSVEAASAASRAGGRVVLLVESHPVLRPMLAEALRSVGCVVVECESRERGLVLARSREHPGADAGSPIDLVVCEAAGGAGASREAQAAFETALGRSVPVLAMCSLPEAQPSASGAASMASDRARCAALVKPFDILDLTTAVDALLA